MDFLAHRGLWTEPAEQNGLDACKEAWRAGFGIETDIRDIGQVVGQGGSVISAIRTIVSAWGGKNRMQVNLVYLTERKKRCPRTASQRA